MTYRQRADWNAAPPRVAPTRWKDGQPDRLVVHWVGVPYIHPGRDAAYYAGVLRSIQSYELREGYADIAYNVAVDPNGTVWEARGWDYQSGANGSREWNRRAFAVVYLGGTDGTRSTPLTEHGQHGLRWVWAAAHQKWPQLRGPALPHSAVRPTYTQCPGDAVRAWLPNMELVTPESEELDVDEATLRKIVREEAGRTSVAAAGAVMAHIDDQVVARTGGLFSSLRAELNDPQRRLGSLWRMVWNLYHERFPTATWPPKDRPKA